MSDNPTSFLLGAQQSNRPPSQRSNASSRSKDPNQTQETTEATSLLSNNADQRDYGDAPSRDDHNSAAFSLRSLQTERSSSGKKRRRWPSIVAFCFLTALVLAILGLGFAAPAVVEEYAKEAMVFEPTGLSIDAFTSTGVKARVQGDFTLDGSRVQKKAVRDLGRAGTWIAGAVESKESRIKVYLPEHGDILLGTAVVPRIVVSIKDGVTTHVDFLADLYAGDLDGVRGLANEWLEGRLGRLSVRGTADVLLKSGLLGLGTQRLSQTVMFGGTTEKASPAPMLSNEADTRLPRERVAYSSKIQHHEAEFSRSRLTKLGERHGSRCIRGYRKQIPRQVHHTSSRLRCSRPRLLPRSALPKASRCHHGTDTSRAETECQGSSGRFHSTAARPLDRCVSSNTKVPSGQLGPKLY